MSYLALTHEPTPYQTSHMRDTHLLAALEDACAPYLRAGYKITSHSQDSFVVVRDRAPVSVLAVILLLPIPLLSLLYIIIARNRRDSVACVRVNSRGQIEESGDTLAAVRSASRRSAVVVLAMVAVFPVIVFAFFLRGADSGNNSNVAQRPVARNSSAAADYFNSDVPRSGITTKRSKQRSKAAEAYNSYPADASDLTPPVIPATPDATEPTEPTTLTRKDTKPDASRVVNESDVVSPAKSNATVYNMSDVDTPAAVTSHAEPIYDPADVPTPGMVQLEAILRPDKTVTDIRVTKGLSPKLTSAAITAARAITFVPAIKDGKPVPMLIRLTYNFTTN